MALTQPDMPLGAKMLLGLSHPVHWFYRVQGEGGFQSQLIFRDYDILDSCEWWEGKNSATSWSTQGQPELVEEVWSDVIRNMGADRALETSALHLIILS